MIRLSVYVKERQNLIKSLSLSKTIKVPAEKKTQRFSSERVVKFGRDNIAKDSNHYLCPKRHLSLFKTTFLVIQNDIIRYAYKSHSRNNSDISSCMSGEIWKAFIDKTSYEYHWSSHVGSRYFKNLLLPCVIVLKFSTWISQIFCHS